MMKQENIPLTSEITVIGGGIAGVLTALELAEKGHKVILVEKYNGVLEGTSDRTPCRLGLGLHYIDVETAKEYFLATLKFIKKFSDYRLKINNESLQGSDYVLMEDSQFKYPAVAKIHSALVDYYKDLIKSKDSNSEENSDNKGDSSNKVFGEPDELIKLTTNIDKRFKNEENHRIEGCFKTKEEILDWPRLKQHLVEELEKHKNIKLLTGTEVRSIEHSNDFCDEQGRYNGKVIEFKLNCKNKNNETFVIKSDQIVNCAWYDISRLNRTINHPSQEEYCKRLKAMLEIELPEEFKDVRTTFFCFGAFCSITNLGDGRAYVTYEPETNVSQTIDEVLPENMQDFIDGKASIEEILKISKKILDGVNKFIPGICKAKVLHTSFGIVMTSGGNVDINDPNSPHHQRREHGINELELGVSSNASMKLLYGVNNAEEIRKIVAKHDHIKATLMKQFNGLAEQFISTNDSKKIVKIAVPQKRIISHFFREHILNSEKIAITDETSVIENEIEKWTNVYSYSLFQKDNANRSLQEAKHQLKKNINPQLFETPLFDELKNEPEVSPRTHNTDSGSCRSNVSSLENITLSESLLSEESWEELSEHENTKSSSENNKLSVFDQNSNSFNKLPNITISNDNVKKDFINRNQELKPMFFKEDQNNKPENNTQKNTDFYSIPRFLRSQIVNMAGNNTSEENNKKTNNCKNENVITSLVNLTNNKN